MTPQFPIYQIIERFDATEQVPKFGIHETAGNDADVSALVHKQSGFSDNRALQNALPGLDILKSQRGAADRGGGSSGSAGTTRRFDVGAAALQGRCYDDVTIIPVHRRVSERHALISARTCIVKRIDIQPERHIIISRSKSA